MSKTREAFERYYATKPWPTCFDFFEAGYQAAMTQDLNEYRDTMSQQAELLAAHKAEMQDWQRAMLAAQQENEEYRAALERIASCHVEQGMSMQQHATNVLAKHSPEDEIERARRMV